MKARLLVLLGFFVGQSMASAEPLIWYKYDLPPLHIVRGPDEGRGQLDGATDFLMAHLKGYEITVVVANIPRIVSALSGPTLGIAAGFQKNSERTAEMTFSAPFLVARAPSLVINKQDHGLVASYLNSNGQVDLGLWIAAQPLGVVAGRSYTAALDELLRQKDSNLVKRYSSDELAEGLLKMVASRRIVSALAFEGELQRLHTHNPDQSSQLETWPVAGVSSGIPVYLVSNRTSAGERLIHQINALLKQYWADPDFRTSAFVGVDDHTMIQQFLDRGYQGP